MVALTTLAWWVMPAPGLVADVAATRRVIRDVT
jgi:hypothetical protein